MEQIERLELRIAEANNSLAPFLESPQEKIYSLPEEDQLDILAAIQHYFELVYARVRMENPRDSGICMEAHADVNFWKHKVMNAKAKLRLKISDKERGL